MTIDLSSISVVKPRIEYSFFIPLGENGIIQLVDIFRKRNDVIIEYTIYIN